MTDRWAGYFETPGNVDSASATWVVPDLVCSGTETTLSSTWIGVGGLAGGTLLQAGMYDNCLGGQAVHGAFAEEYPGGTASFGLLITAGDTITATVADQGGGWEASVTDDSNGESESASAPDYAGGGSAEWMAESYGEPDYPMSNFGTEALSMFTVNGGPARVPEDDVWAMPDVAPSDPQSGVYRLTYD